jgi:hypothetical protein
VHDSFAGTVSAFLTFENGNLYMEGPGRPAAYEFDGKSTITIQEKSLHLDAGTYTLTPEGTIVGPKGEVFTKLNF